LLKIAATNEPADSHSHPAEFSHQLCQTPARSGSSTTRSNSLNAVIADFTAQPLQAQPPWIGITRSQFGLRFMQLL
jgi:hypothetical protein